MPTGTQRAPAAKGPESRGVYLAAFEEPLRVENGGVGTPYVGIRVDGRGGYLHQGAFGEQVSILDVDVLVYDQRARRSPHEAQNFVGSRDEKRTPLAKGGNIDAEFRLAIPCALNSVCQLRTDPGQQHSVLHNVPDCPENDRHGVDDEGAEHGEEIASAVVGVPIEPACHVAKLADELRRLSVGSTGIFGKFLKGLNETSTCPCWLCGRERWKHTHGKSFYAAFKLPIMRWSAGSLYQRCGVTCKHLTRNRAADLDLV